MVDGGINGGEKRGVGERERTFMEDGARNQERREVGGREKKSNNGGECGEGKGGGERAKWGRGGGGGEKVAPAATSSSAAYQNAMLLPYLVAVLSWRSATTKWGPLAVAAQ